MKSAPLILGAVSLWCSVASAKPGDLRWVRDPVAVIRNAMDRQAAAQDDAYWERRRKGLDASAAVISMPSPAPPAVANDCSALVNAIAARDAGRIQSVMSTAPRPGPWPATVNLGDVVKAWVSHCGLDSGSVVVIARAFGVDVPKPQGRSGALNAVDFSDPPPGRLPPALASATDVVADPEPLGNLVPGRGVVSLQRTPVEGPATMLRIMTTASKTSAAGLFMRELKYERGELHEIVDTYFCPQSAGGTRPCQSSRYAYRGGVVKTVSIERDGVVTQPPTRILPTAMPSYSPGDSPIILNHAPTAAVFSLPPPPRQAPSWPETPSKDEAERAYSVDAGKLKQVVDAHFNGLGALEWVKIVLSDELGQVGFERTIFHKENRVTQFWDQYSCALQGVVVPCGQVKYRYEQARLTTVEATRASEPEWQQKATERLPPPAPKGAVFVARKPAGSGTRFHRKFAHQRFVELFAPSPIPAGFVVSGPKEPALATTWIVTNPSGQEVFRRGLAAVPVDANFAQPVLVVDEYACGGESPRPCGGVEYRYFGDGALAELETRAPPGKRPTSAPREVPKRGLFVLPPPPKLLSSSIEGHASAMPAHVGAVPASHELRAGNDFRLYADGDTGNAWFEVSKDQRTVFKRTVSVRRESSTLFRITRVMDWYFCDGKTGITPCGIMFHEYEDGSLASSRWQP